MTRELIYFADPMCSWCYGFAPVISAIERVNDLSLSDLEVRQAVETLRASVIS